MYKKTVILPRKFIEEIKGMPDSQLSFQRDVYERLVGQHTMIGSHEHSMIQSVKLDLTTNIARVQADLQDEAAFAVTEQFGECQGGLTLSSVGLTREIARDTDNMVDWTSINCFPRLLRVIALMSGRVFVGLPLCRNEEWVNIKPDPPGLEL